MLTLNTMKVFLSYSESDKAAADVLDLGLKEAGLEVWDFRNDLAPGVNLHLEIGKALERSDAMIVLLSPDSVKSGSVLAEIEYALSSSQFRGRLIPVLIRPTEAIPWILRKLQIIRATKDISETVRRIVSALEKSPVAAGK